MDDLAALPAGLLERYPAQKRALETLDALDAKLDDVERRAAVRRSFVGTPGVGGAALSLGVLRVWVSHAVTLPNKTNPSRSVEAAPHGRWTLKIDGGFADDGCGGGADASGAFGDIVERLEVSLDRKQGRGPVVCWAPPRDGSHVEGFTLSRAFRGQRATQCFVRVALYPRAKFAPRRVSIAPALAKVLRCARDSESREQVVAGVSAYIDSKGLRDPRDARMVLCDEKLSACFNGLQTFAFGQLESLLEPLLAPPEPFSLDYTITTEDAAKPTPFDFPLHCQVPQPFCDLDPGAVDHTLRDREVLLIQRAREAWEASR